MDIDLIIDFILLGSVLLFFGFGIFVKIYKAITDSINSKIRIKNNKIHDTFKIVLQLLVDTPPEDYVYVPSNLPDTLSKEELKLIDKITRNVEKSIDNSYELVPNLSFSFAEFVAEVTDLSNNHQYTSPAKCLVTKNKDKTYYFILEFHYPNSGFERFYLPLNRLPGENKTSVNFKYPRLCITEEGKQFKIKLLKKNVKKLLIDKNKYKNFRKDNI